MPHPQDIVHEHSIQNPEAFWGHHAQDLHWHKQPSRALSRSTKTLPGSGSTHDHWTWFPDGEISTTYNCVDRHVECGNGDNVAIIWESSVTGVRETYTYRQLQDEVEVLAGVLREEGVRRGDVVIIYSTFIYLLIDMRTTDLQQCP
jgi:propionyl-CoA synthetase